ncbi:MAG: hypothetical protein ACRDZ9_00975, partial [Acidimicrobiales bacterium]
MPRRMEVELTSRRDDGTWTWRAAGAREPRGVVDGHLLHPGARVGDVVQAQAVIGIDGIDVTAVHPPKADRSEPARLEVVGPPSRPEPGDDRRSRPGRPHPRPGPRADRRREPSHTGGPPSRGGPRGAGARPRPSRRAAAVPG